MLLNSHIIFLMHTHIATGCPPKISTYMAFLPPTLLQQDPEYQSRNSGGETNNAVPTLNVGGCAKYHFLKELF